MVKTQQKTARRLFLSAFLEGMSGAGLYGVRVYRAPARASSDRDALRSDWLRIGEDIRGAAKKARAEFAEGA